MNNTGIKPKVIEEIRTFARSNVAHSYNERIALGIVMRAKESFYDMFCELKKEIDKNWL